MVNITSHYDERHAFVSRLFRHRLRSLWFSSQFAAFPWCPCSIMDTRSNRSAKRIKDFSSDCHRFIFHSHSIIVHIIWPQNCQLQLSHSMWCWKLFDLVVPACRNCIHRLYMVSDECQDNVNMFNSRMNAPMVYASTAIVFIRLYWVQRGVRLIDIGRCSEVFCIVRMHSLRSPASSRHVWMNWWLILIFWGYDTSTLRLHPIAFHILHFSFSFRLHKVSIHKNINFLLLFCLQVSCLERWNVLKWWWWCLRHVRVM